MMPHMQSVATKPDDLHSVFSSTGEEQLLCHYHTHNVVKIIINCFNIFNCFHENQLELPSLR